MTLSRVAALVLTVAACSPPGQVSIAPGTNVASPSVRPTGPTSPTSGSTPSPTRPAVASAAASPMTYVVQPGDTLSGIADRFGITVGQLLAANPQLANPDAIRAGDVLVIPPRDAPTGLPLADGLRDAAGDLVDEADQPAFAPGYADLTGFGVRLDPDTLYLELVLVAPPRPADPTLERLDYVVHLDLSGDGEADRRLRVSNALEPDEDFAAVLEDLATGTVSDPAAFPGTVSFGDRSVRIVIERAALGNPRRYDAAALVERRFLPDEPEAEVSVDRSPDQQWPRQNARWVSVGR